MLDQITLPTAAAEESVLQKLEQFGIAILPGFVSAQDTAALRVECLQLIDREEKNRPKDLLTKGDSKVVRINGGVDASQFPLTACFFSSPKMDSVARSYFSPYPYTLNDQIYITHDRNRMDFSTKWHTDPSRSLKFFLYLTDATRRTGAFMYAPGSQREGYYRLISSTLQGLKDPPNLIPELEVPSSALSVEGPAGSLIIFEAAGMHKAGELENGQERLVIRGHSYPKTSRLGKFIRRILLQSPFNLARYNLCEDNYVNDRFKTRAQVYRE